MNDVTLIPYYQPGGAEVEAAAERVRGRVPAIDGLKNRVEKDHRNVLDTVAGDLKSSMADAPSKTTTKANDVTRKAEFAAGCLELFAQRINDHNHNKSDRPRSVWKLNAEYNQRLDDRFGVKVVEPGPNATPNQWDQAWDAFWKDFGDKKAALIHDLRKEAAELDAWLDERADDVSKMLKRGPNEEDIRALWRAGALSPYAPMIFPKAGLAKIKLPPGAQREFVEDLGQHPEFRRHLPPALEAIVDQLAEQRMADLRREGLLNGPNPGGRYEQWIRNTLLGGVQTGTVVAIARDHGVRPEDFDVLNGLKEVKDRDGKSFFLLPTDISGEDAKKAVLMTYILNAGTGYGANGEPTDFTPEPYDSDEIQRIIDRQNANDWSYDDDVDFVHDNDGRLVTTPNGMLMGIGGKDVYSQDGGTTWGDIFMVNENPDIPEQRLGQIIESGVRPGDDPNDGYVDLDLDRLLHHEERHSQQWDRELAPWYGMRYVTWESMFGLKEGWANSYEREAGLEDGGYELPREPTPSPGPSPTPPP